MFCLIRFSGLPQRDFQDSRSCSDDTACRALDAPADLFLQYACFDKYCRQSKIIGLKRITIGIILLKISYHDMLKYPYRLLARLGTIFHFVYDSDLGNFN